MLFLLPAFPRSVGLRPIAPPKTRLPHGATGGLPFPIYAVQRPASLDQGGLDSLLHSTLYPTLESSVDGTVIPQILG